MNKEEQVQAVREKIYNHCVNYLALYKSRSDYNAYTVGDELTDQILSIPELAILDKDQSLPKNPYIIGFEPDIQIIAIRQAAYNNAQQDMLNAGFKRVIK